MAKKGSWANGKAPAQGGTPQKISKPELGAHKFKGALKKGYAATARSGTSPLDGRKGAK